tara:strand:- start:15530 stop:16753 length:1224 start_codon:yes stop_codon:yes gene_type:complete
MINHANSKQQLKTKGYTTRILKRAAIVTIDLPTPDQYGQDISRDLRTRINKKLSINENWMSFDQYMNCVLYDTEFGYYHNGSPKFGSAGDFVTAPELSGLFGRALAEPIINIIEQMRDPVILEVGAGTGQLAVDLIGTLSAHSVYPRYYILETSAELRERQSSLIASANMKVEWLDSLPTKPIQGVVLANEVLDAMPALCFTKQDGKVHPLGVQAEKGNFVWSPGKEDYELSKIVKAIEKRLGYVLPDGFRSEVCPARDAWITTMAGIIEKGAILTIDYGLTEREYYHEQRNSGTLSCYFKHRMHRDPFKWPGLQDISVWVDFSACARAAEKIGLSVAGYTTQGQFLANSAAIQQLGIADTEDEMRVVQSLKTLLLPGEMGERFKLLLLSRNLLQNSLPGRDFRDRL